ncbi:NAD-P-binding protein [Amylostereum chailletii]|nr:NAD-P-binding protein [Amylostereum chailletii]
MADAILSKLTADCIFDLRGVVAVVTGGGSGIGLMISSTLVANGATVYIIGPKQSDLDRIAKVYNDATAQKEGGGKLIGLEGDIRSKSEALRLAEEIGKREKHITVLFNNAGIAVGAFVKPTTATADAFKKAYFDPISQDAFNDSLNTNAVGPYWLSFAFLPLLEAWKSNGELAQKFVPQVIMTSSMNGWTKDPATSGSSFPYMFSKSALGHFTASLAHELLPLGIRVNGIAPGLSLISEMSVPGTSNEFGQSRVNKSFSFVIPANSGGGSNRDMGSLALMLIANGFINGETVLIDGGTLLVHPSSY